ncbi:MAG TPA: GNAT family N-acetyltransferase [Longimicrobium sp.]|nr:GNAT family N-acetyltransferase [Longimicrobium sp.]
MDALQLGRRERDHSIRYQEVSALKLAQLGVARPFQGMGVGRLVVADVINRARREAEHVGCRYVTLDARPDLVVWYELQGFKRNVLRQEKRVDDAVAHGRDPASIPVSMRYDLGPNA